MKKFKNLRDSIVGVDTAVPLPDGRLASYINFDNAATTPPFKSVMKKINDFAPWYSSIHRGKGYKSVLSSQDYEKSREIIADFVNCDLDTHEVIFVKNTSEAINKLAARLAEQNEDDDNDEDDKVVLTSEMEHHSNDLPWRGKFKVDYIKTDKYGRLSLEDVEAKLIQYRGRVELVTVAGVSNVTGYINPVYKIAALAHSYGTKILVDGAQLIPHLAFDMKSENVDEQIDFLVFSAHKMYAPFGIGVLITPTSVMEKGSPDYSGGGTVEIVTQNQIIWDSPPHKDEAGTPNIMGVVALVEAIKTLEDIGMDLIEKQERNLTEYAFAKLRRIKDLIIYGDYDLDNRVGIIPFNIDGLTDELVATELSNKAGIAVRNGCFCAHPYVKEILNISDKVMIRRINNPNLPRPGLVRASFGLYNTTDEIDKLVEMIKKLVQNKNEYSRKYREINKTIR